MADILDIGISGLRVHQAALTVTGNNITNANTEGYSRQDIVINQQNSQFLGGVWLGNGAILDDVRRIYDEFLVNQLRTDTSTFNELETLANNSGQIDSLLADPGTGLQPGLESFFGSMQAAIDDPSSIPARQVVLSESQGLVDRFQTIDARLRDLNTTINGQMETIVGQVNALGDAIAELNKQILLSTAGANGEQPNDLLDKRDLALKNLSELVGTTVVEQDGNSVNVAIGNGQSLVVGTDVQKLSVANGENDPQRKSIVISQKNSVQDITRELTGGKLTGLIEFRKQVLDPAISQLGRASLAMQQSINEQHRLGIDLEGTPGELFFEDINRRDVALRRAVGNADNAMPNDREVAVYIEDSNALTSSDYLVEFTGPNDVSFRVTRVSDGKEMLTSAITTDFPDEYEIDGFKLSFEDGSFSEGDKFYLMPTRTGAKDIELNLEIPQQLALASPVMTDTSVGNRGSGEITTGDVFDVDTGAFSIPGTLNPPLLFKFTSDTTYDVLDNTDPANPIPLFPPIMNQQYVPGVTNQMLPTNMTEKAVTSLGGYIPPSPSYQDWREAPTTPGNGLFPARVTVSEPNPITGKNVDRPTVFIPENTPASEIARILSQEDGISASARTTVELKNFTAGTHDPNSPFPDEPVHLYLNGIEISDELGVDQLKYDTPYPETVPEPLTPNFIADRINANFNFRDQGIVARSDGESVEIISLTGEDLAFEIDGETGDGFEYSNGKDTYLNPVGNSLPRPLTENSGFDFTEGGPYLYEFEIPGQNTFQIELDEAYETAADLETAIKDKIEDTPYYFNGEIDVDIDTKGNISFQTRLQVNGAGDFGSYKVTMGGEVKVVLEEDLTFNSDPNLSNLFEEEPELEPTYLGYEIEMTGFPKDGDEFSANFNSEAVTDSRNGNKLAGIQNKEVIEGDMTLSEGYGKLVEDVGSITARAQINEESAKTLLDNSQNNVYEVSGVNLDEEAGKLIQYELGYNASAQVISVAQQIFETLIGTFR